MRTFAWAATIALTNSLFFAACSEQEPTDQDSNGGAGGAANPDGSFFAAEDEPTVVLGGADANGMGGADAPDPGVLCDRFTEFDDPLTAYKAAKDRVASQYPGYIVRDCRIAGYADDLQLFGEVRNGALELTLELWRCEDYRLDEEYDPAKDFPLLVSSWKFSEEEILAFTDAYLGKVTNSGLEFTEFELAHFRERIAEIAEGAADPSLTGFSRSRCDEGQGGAGGENPLP